MKVLYTGRSKADLTAIGDFIAADNPVRAPSFIRELRQVCESIGDNPLAFPVAEGIEASNVRKRSWRRYLIFYRVLETHVIILTAIHGARNYPALFRYDA